MSDRRERLTRAAELKARAEALLREAAAIEAFECTSLTAAWCPVCGNCSCPDRESALDHRDCPLHSLTSIHAER